MDIGLPNFKIKPDAPDSAGSPVWPALVAPSFELLDFRAEIKKRPAGATFLKVPHGQHDRYGKLDRYSCIRLHQVTWSFIYWKTVVFPVDDRISNPYGLVTIP